LEVTYQVMSCA